MDLLKRSFSGDLSYSRKLTAIAALALASFAFQTEAISQDFIPVAPDSAKTVKLSDLPPEVVSKIKSEHYAAQSQNIQQAYHQQLLENRQRAAFSARQAAFEQSVKDRRRNGDFSPAVYQAPVGFQPPVAQVSHNSAFPRTAASKPDEYIAQPTGPTPTAAYSAPQSAEFSAPSSAGYSSPPDTAYSAPPNAAPNAAPKAAYSAPQTFTPPVHISPTQPQYTAAVAGSSINGQRNAVQNFAPQKTSTRTRSAASRAFQRPFRRKQPSRKVAQAQPTQAQPTQAQPTPAQPAPQQNTHVFLQDRIANALARHFKRGKKPKEQSSPELLATNEVASTVEEPVLETAALSPPVYQPTSNPQPELQSEIVHDDYQSAPYVDQTIVASDKFIDDQSYSEILQGNKYTSRTKRSGIASADIPADHQIVSKGNARRRSIERAVHHDNDIESFELSVGEEDSSILDRYENIRQASAEHGDQREPHPLRSSKKKKRRPRVAAYSRPDKYSPTTKETPAENVSILLQEEEDIDDSPFADADDFKPAENDIDLESAREEFDLESERSQGSGTKDRPNLRDDLRDADEDRENADRSLRDRVRSRLDDELDLEELDREIDEELDEELDAELDEEDFENDRPNRAPRKTCRQFQNELIAGSIRDIALDISPPAANEGAQYGGLARTWTDRRGNILATGALVDLRRGYVILDSGQKLAYARLSEADLAAVSEFWRLPEVCVIGNSGGSPYRSWTPQVVTWKASNLCHKPLYFENIQLERYGHSRGPVAQPIHSTLHFFTRLIALPYMTGICPPNECEYALGYYRPGNCAPWLKEPVPISLEGIRRETLFVTGAAFIP